MSMLVSERIAGERRTQSIAPGDGMWLAEPCGAGPLKCLCATLNPLLLVVGQPTGDLAGWIHHRPRCKRGDRSAVMPLAAEWFGI
jgi:hypothetical protein